MTSSYGRIAATTLGIGLAVGAYFLNRSGSSYYGPSNDQEPTFNPLVARPQPQKFPRPNMGGEVKPQVTGFQNEDGSGRVDPCVWGGPIPVYPPRCITSRIRFVQQNMHIYGALNYGTGDLVVTNKKIGKKGASSFDDLTLRTFKYPTEDFEYFDGDPETQLINTELTFNQWHTVTFEQVGTKIVAGVTFPNGLAAWNATTNAPVNRTVQFAQQYRVFGNSSWNDLPTRSATAHSTSTFFFTLSNTLPSARYEYRIRRITTAGSSDPDGGFYENEDDSYLTFASLTDYSQAPIRARQGKDTSGNTITVPITIEELDAEASDLLQGEIDQFSAHVSRKIRTWNGSTWSANVENSNNGQIMMAMLQGDWFNYPVPDSALDLPAFLNFAQWCDLKGFTYKRVHDQKQTLWEALKDVAAAGLASPAMTMSGKWSVVIDQPKTEMSQLFCEYNTRDFEGSIDYPELSDAIICKFVNSAANFEQDEIVVYADGKNEANTVFYRTIELPGVTTYQHAWKIGRYYLAIERLRNERYFFTTDAEGMRCNRGDLVGFVHSVPGFGSGCGRISAVTVNGSSQVTGFTCTEMIGTTNGVTYDVTVRCPDGTFTTRQIVGDGSEKNAFVFTAPVTSGTQPAVGDLVVFGEIHKCLVENIEYEGQNNCDARITLVDYAPGAYTADAGDIPDHDSDITAGPTLIKQIQAPSNLTAKSDDTVMYKGTDGSPITRVQVSLAQNTDPRVSHLQFQWRLRDSMAWGPTSTIPVATVAYIVGPVDGTYIDMRFRSETKLGDFSEWVLLENHFVVGKTAKPANINLMTQEGLNSIRIHYPNPPIDFAGFRLKVHQGSVPTWGAATLIENLSKNYTFPMGALPSGVITFMARAVDTAGNESATEYKLRAGLGDTPVNARLDVVDHVADGFLGSKYLCAVDGGVLKADVLPANNFWRGGGNKFWRDPFWQTPWAQMHYGWTYNVTMTSITPMSLRVEYASEVDGIPTTSGETFQLYYRKLSAPYTSKYWKGGGAGNHWQRGNQFDLFWTLNDAPWTLMPNSIIVQQNELIQFRLVIASSNERGVVNVLKSIVDVPNQTDVIETTFVGEDPDTAASGTRLTLNKAFSLISSVTLTIEADGSYPDAFTAQVLDKQATAGVRNGPLIKVFNTAGAAVKGRVHAVVRGVPA